METKENILDEVVFETIFTIEDILEEIDGESRGIWDTLKKEEQQDLINRHIHDIKKGMESGIMSDWWIVARTASEGLTDELRRKGRQQ